MTDVAEKSASDLAAIEAAADEYVALLEEEQRVAKHRRLEAVYWEPGSVEFPYGWQIDFHHSPKPQRGIIAANQTGKTRTVSAEVALHSHGSYPPWWKGKRYDKATDWIVAGTSWKDVRDVQQEALVGAIEPGKRKPSGTGWIPLSAIVDWGWQQGVDRVLDYVMVKHVNGGVSRIYFKTYVQGVEKFQGKKITGGIWLDEEPEEADEEIFGECLARLSAGGGIFLFSRTPLLGRTKIVRHFLQAENPYVFHVSATWEDCPHITKAKREELKATFPAHELATRTEGKPMMGSGGVYSVSEDVYVVDPMPIPMHWPRICGVDFGIAHPFGCLWIAEDPATSCRYVYDEYRIPGEVPAIHAVAIKARGGWIPTAWPHDGMSRDKGSGKPLASIYREHGVNLLQEPAAWAAEVMESRGIKAQSRETGNLMIVEMMRAGTFRVMRNCEKYRQELRELHRKDGKINDVDDDLESAGRYAMMMFRHAVTDDYGEEVDMHSAEYDPLADFGGKR